MFLFMSSLLTYATTAAVCLHRPDVPFYRCSELLWSSSCHQADGKKKSVRPFIPTSGLLLEKKKKKKLEYSPAQNFNTIRLQPTPCQHHCVIFSALLRRKSAWWLVAAGKGILPRTLFFTFISLGLVFTFLKYASILRRLRRTPVRTIVILGCLH